MKWMVKTATAGDISQIQTLQVTKIMNISKSLQEISNELDSLDEKIKSKCLKYLAEISGTFCWRVIAQTNRLSAHSFGMTLDLNAKHCEYWLWDLEASLKRTNPNAQIPLECNIPVEDIPPWRNTVPYEIVEIFEKYGFMWGGKWAKYDTMHFEYRPECFINPEVKLRIRQLLSKEGYKFVESLKIKN